MSKFLRTTIRKINGPTSQDRAFFLNRIKSEIVKDGNEEKVFELLAKEAGMSYGGVRKWFTNLYTDNAKDVPFSVWRLWHITLFQEDILNKAKVYYEWN